MGSSGNFRGASKILRVATSIYLALTRPLDSRADRQPGSVPDRSDARRRLRTAGPAQEPAAVMKSKLPRWAAIDFPLESVEYWLISILVKFSDTFSIGSC